jgi:acyl-CoA synthetase (NDP forming)
VLESLIDHAETRAILLYLEAIRDGRRLIAATRRAHSTGKPVVLIVAGATAAAARAARSHTGALTTGATVINAACRAGGIVEVASLRQAVAAIQVLLPRVRLCGPRLGFYAEILDDTAVALGPVDVEAAAGMIRSLRGASLLHGARGRPLLDIEGAAAFVARFSTLAAAHPEIAEAEVNPLLVLPDRVVALDARIALASIN